MVGKVAQGHRETDGMTRVEIDIPGHAQVRREIGGVARAAPARLGKRSFEVDGLKPPRRQRRGKSHRSVTECAKPHRET